MLTDTLLSSFTAAAAATHAAAQYPVMSAVMGPWFNENLMGITGDYGEGATIEAATEITKRTAEKLLSPASRQDLRVRDVPPADGSGPNTSLATTITLKSGAGVSTTSHASSPVFFAPSGPHGKNQTLWYQLYPGDFNRTTVLEKLAIAKVAGFRAALVTNHGGRQSDGAPAPL
ncbi:hypothetical protein C8R43DRAFT_1141568 [Mycena crocata]|nr:hypothetical protein C8R43DRAFT_1141568 [Mycena crocata]